MPTVVLTGGGSGGHITPLLSLAPELKARGCRLVYIGLKGDRVNMQTEYAVFDETFFISSGKFRRYHGESLLARLVDLKTALLNIRDFFKVINGFFQARKILKKIKPDVVFSKGGFVVVPVGMAAKLHHIPIVTHDSDSVPGLASRLIGRWAAIHATGMPPENYPYPKDKIRYTGIPLDKRIKPVSESAQAEFKDSLGIPAGSKVLLVAGGGLGSQKINEAVAAMAPQLLKHDPELWLLHIAGSVHVDAINTQYDVALDEQARGRVKAIGFSNEFYKFSGAADLIIARAGASTIAEFAAQQKACIIIPSPFLTGGHQLKNAEELQNKKAAVVLPNDVASSELLNKVTELLDNKKSRDELSHNIGALARVDAAEKLAEILVDVAEGKEVRPE